MRRVMSLVLTMAILFSLIMACGVTVHAASELTMSDAGVEMIKSFEGFSKKPYWDVNQYTVGYGTRCPSDKVDEYKANGITEEEAVELLRTYIASYEKAVNYFADKYALELTQNEFDALVSFSYNLGSGWVYSSSGNFHKTMANPDSTDAQILYWFGAHCSAGGTVLTGLIRRRAAEANLYLNGEYGTSRPSNYKYIKYDANGGSLTSRINLYDINTADRVQQIPTYEGYTFEGWFTGAAGGTEVTVLDESTHTDTLYAHWSGGETAEDTPEEDTTVEEETPEQEETPEEEEPSYEEQEVSMDVTVTSNEVNLRKGPGTNYTTIGTAYKGEVYSISKMTVVGSRTWGYYGDGWICLNYTSYMNPIEEEEPEEPAAVTGTVKVSSYLTVRSGAGTGYSSVGKLYNGDKVEILEQKVVGATTWGRIEEGWISMDYVVLDTAEEPEETPEETPEEDANTDITGTVTASSLLIRTGPGTSYDVAGSLKKGASVTITETKEVGSTTWGKISKGWISMTYVSLSSGSDSSNSSSGSDSSDNSNSSSSSGSTSAGVTGTVDAEGSLRIRSGPGSSYSVVGYVADGEKVTITETKVVGATTWGKITKGWISLDYVDLDGSLESVADIRTVTASCLKVRKDAGTGYSVVDYLYSGDKVEILETKTVNGTQWGRIATGWISLEYTK